MPVTNDVIAAASPAYMQGRAWPQDLARRFSAIFLSNLSQNGPGTELVNAIQQKEPSDADFERLQQHFTDSEIAELGYAIAVIKGWNLLNISLRNQIPELPAPGF